MAVGGERWRCKKWKVGRKVGGAGKMGEVTKKCR